MNTPGPDQPSRPGGHIEISDHAIISVAHVAVLSCCGILNLAPGSIRSALGKGLGFSSTERGIGVSGNDNTASVALPNLVECCIPIFTVAAYVMKTTRFHLESVLGMSVPRVKVIIDGLRVSKVSGGSA